MPSFVRAAALGAALLACAGCGRSVAVQPLPLSTDTAKQACAGLTADLPRELSAGRQWSVEPDPGSTSAWGSPPVVLRCGDEVPAPGATDQLLQVNGVTWWVRTLTQGEEYVTVGRSPGVIITVPSDYAPTSAVLAELVPVVAQHTG